MKARPRVTLAPDRKALVTGGASGIGRAVAQALIAEGATVAIVDVSEANLQQAVGELGDGAVAIRADVRSTEDVASAVEEATEALGGLDTLVASAGVVHVKPLAEVSEADWDRVLDVNLKGAFLCSQAAAPALSASGRGRIVMISSDAGRRGSPLLQAYCASKFGLIGLAESLAVELAPNVTVNSVCPVGVPSTGMGQQMLDWKTGHTGKDPDAVLSGIARSIPMARNATDADIAAAVLFFASEAASFLTGVALDVDGGASLDTIPGSD